MTKLLVQALQLPDLNDFAGFVLQNRKKISPRVFAEEFGKIQRCYLREDEGDLFCSEANNIASKLAEEECSDFAGIIISGLCKVVEYIPHQLEGFAKKGYELAKQNGDVVHMMARLNDLRRVYFRNPERVYDYVQVLYKQEKCLKELTRNYENAVSGYNTIVRKPASKEAYSQMLAHVQTEIGKLTKRKYPKSAAKKLLNAREIFEAHGNRRSVEYINMLLSEIENQL